MAKKQTIRKNDYNRVLVTETLPFETPLIFSNDGLYLRLLNLSDSPLLVKKIIEALVFGVNEGKSCPYTIPYLYKVRKNSNEYRRLALVHPRSQWKMKEFYEKFESLIAHHCAQSPASMRAPKRVASTYFVRNKLQNLNQYKKASSVALSDLDKLTKHSPTFFAYRGYDRLYKFFESREYFDLEKRYSVMTSLDVSKCFDSIYTHTIAWAVKDKEFTKSNMPISGTFADDFDCLMMHANHSETNGIVIGPEVSRIFAEIILQEVDLRAIKRISERHALDFGEHYKFRRYVDDVFIFALNEDVSSKVYSEYTDALLKFNLHSNIAKKTTKLRPFITEKSRIVLAASAAVNEFMEKFLDSEDENGSLKPKPIRSRFRLTKSFIEAIKVLCSDNGADYDQVSSYLISVLNERIKRIVSTKRKIEDVEADGYLDASIVLIETLFFLYQVSPSVSASYRFCTSIILLMRFTQVKIPGNYQTIAQRIHELTEQLLMDHKSKFSDSVDGFLALEVLNVLLTSRELGEDFLLPERTIEDFFFSAGKPNYFSIVSFLYYVRDSESHVVLKNKIISEANKLLGLLEDIRQNSEKAYLLLDLLSCPYIDNKTKRKWILAACKSLSITSPSKIETDACSEALLAMHAHVDWNDLDLLNTLEKKELKRAY